MVDESPLLVELLLYTTRTKTRARVRPHTVNYYKLVFQVYSSLLKHLLKILLNNSKSL